MTANERDVGRNLEVPCAPDCQRDISQVFRWDKDARNGRPVVSGADQPYDDLPDVCDAVPCTEGVANRDL